jgi:effector-binding domain-containing protein
MTRSQVLRAIGAIAFSAGALLAGACQVAPDAGSRPRRAGEPALLPDLAVSHAPHDAVEVQWKQRLEEPYVYLEARGSYTGIGALLERAHALMAEAGIEASGPPFALFYDDPGLVPVEELRMRACFPVGAGVRPAAPLAADRLPSTTVVYAFIAGPYPEVPRAYPKLFAFLDELGWVLDGPIREIYLVNPALVADWEELVAEVQLPAAAQP